MAYIPEFDIDNEMLNLVSDISVLVDRISYDDVPSRHLMLRRANRIRSIHSSLAIEGNTLSLEKVTDVIDGRRVFGDPREITEVKGALIAYELMETLDPYSIEDLLKAHETMMAGLVDRPGSFRRCGVGVYKGNVPVHIAPDFEDVPDLIDDLMQWTEDSDTHPLIKGCVFHCRFEYIHPFVDGNGRMGRLWHSLILSKWKGMFAYLPIETWIKANQQEYYNVLLESDSGDLTPFVKFMLRMIKTAVNELVEDILSTPQNSSDRVASVLNIISNDPWATAASMAKMLGVSDRTVKRYLASLTEKGSIRRVGSDKTGRWEII